MVDILVEIIGALGLVAVAVLQLRSEQERKRRKTFDAQNEERRREELEMGIKQGEVMLASGDLAYVTSLAVTGGHTNGNVEEAQTKFTKAKQEYETLQTRLANKYLRVD